MSFSKNSKRRNSPSCTTTNRTADSTSSSRAGPGGSKRRGFHWQGGGIPPCSLYRAERGGTRCAVRLRFEGCLRILRPNDGYAINRADDRFLCARRRDQSIG